MNPLFKTCETIVREPYVEEFFFDALGQSNRRNLDAAKDSGSTSSKSTSDKYMKARISINDWTLQAETWLPETNPMMPLDSSVDQRMPNIHTQLAVAKVHQPLMYDQLCKNQPNSNIPQLITVYSPENLRFVAQVEQPE